MTRWFGGTKKAGTDNPRLPLAPSRRLILLMTCCVCAFYFLGSTPPEATGCCGNPLPGSWRDHLDFPLASAAALEGNALSLYAHDDGPLVFATARHVGYYDRGGRRELNLPVDKQQTVLSSPAYKVEVAIDYDERGKGGLMGTAHSLPVLLPVREAVSLTLHDVSDTTRLNTFWYDGGDSTFHVVRYPQREVGPNSAWLVMRDSAQKHWLISSGAYSGEYWACLMWPSATDYSELSACPPGDSGWSTAVEIQVGQTYAVWFGAGDAWNVAQSRYGKVRVESIDSSSVTLKVGVQAYGGMRWVLTQPTYGAGDAPAYRAELDSSSQ